MGCSETPPLTKPVIPISACSIHRICGTCASILGMLQTQENNKKTAEQKRKMRNMRTISTKKQGKTGKSGRVALSGVVLGEMEVSKQGVTTFAWRRERQYDVATAQGADNVLASDYRTHFGRPLRRGCRIYVTVAGPTARRDNVLASKCEYLPFGIRYPLY